jgi:hypothetical protein
VTGGSSTATPGQIHSTERSQKPSSAIFTTPCSQRKNGRQKLKAPVDVPRVSSGSTRALLLLILSTTIRLSLLENKAGGKWRASLHAFDMCVTLAIQPPLSFQRGKYMSLSIKINRGIFDRVKTAIEEAGHVNMLSWAEGRDSTPVESVNEIRELPLLGDCRTTACIGGMVCHLATSEEIARAAEIYGLSDEDLHEPYTLSAALLLNGAEDKYELESACLPLFSLTHWPPEEQIAYDASQTDAERNQVILRRMDGWAEEIEALQSAKT